MAFEIEHKEWPGDQAVLLVHGIGTQADVGPSQAHVSLQAVLGADASNFAIYELRYDAINDWFAEKQQLASLVVDLKRWLQTTFGGDDFGETVAEFAGDVVWPVLSLSAREALRRAYVAQLQAMVMDGPGRLSQRISVIAHSMGCFHTYETLHYVANEPAEILRPADGTRLENVVFMASPVQLIRSMARAISGLVPRPRSLKCLAAGGLTLPKQSNPREVLYARRVAAITGDMDPVGGHLFRSKIGAGFMELDGAEPFVDQQTLTNVSTRSDLKSLLTTAIRDREPPAITPNNPHDWSAYITRHAADLRGWLV